MSATGWLRVPLEYTVMNDQRTNQVAGTVGAILLPAGLLLSAVSAAGGAALANLAVVLLVWVWWRAQRPVEAVAGSGLRSRWLVLGAFAVTNLLFWFDFLGAVPMRGAEALGVLVVAMILFHLGLVAVVPVRRSA